MPRIRVDEAPAQPIGDLDEPTPDEEDASDSGQKHVKRCIGSNPIHVSLTVPLYLAGGHGCSGWGQLLISCAQTVLCHQ